ncbi:MAG: serine/threonine protein kinase, partial [Chloroflexota bacterium]|nr:serine/threonine protein kinase [Chloroflexota bacterium]
MRQVGAEELVGRTLGEGEYRLVARLGGGGMGAVYEADQTRLRRRVAVKVLWPHLTQEPGLVVRFNREARIAARLEHPHILPIYGFGEESGLLYLVMRLVRGGSLKDRLRGEGLRRQGWSPREALELARQALPPLDYAHRQGVVHRDLKPDNILLEPSDEFPTGYRAFLSDFGIATLAQGDEVDTGVTQTGDALGTPAYMAPEQVLDQRVDGRADLYAFGVMLFEVLVGQVPYRGHTPLGLAMQHVREPVPSARELNPRLPSSIEAVLSKALAKDREDRFRSGAALIEALAEAVELSETESQAVSSRRSRAEPARPVRPTPPPETPVQPEPPAAHANDPSAEAADSPAAADVRGAARQVGSPAGRGEATNAPA